MDRDERIRTSDPLNPIQVRYQTALRPETAFLATTRIQTVSSARELFLKELRQGQKVAAAFPGPVFPALDEATSRGREKWYRMILRASSSAWMRV